MAPNDNNNGSNNPFEKLYRSFFGGDDGDGGGEDIFANFPERANLPPPWPSSKPNVAFPGSPPFPPLGEMMRQLHQQLPPFHLDDKSPSSFRWTSSSSYQIHQDDEQVSVEIDVPGVAAKDLKVEVVMQNKNNYASSSHPSCTVQWNGHRTTSIHQRGAGGGRTDDDGDNGTSQHHQKFVLPTFSNRIRLGPHVDCDKLSAHLSHGILHLRAPLKERREGDDEPEVRSIPISED
jgi:HSP20 family molecular chaperone IbpA